MQLETSGGVMKVKLSRFRVEEAERLHEAVHALGPLSRLVLDFGHVAEFQDAAVQTLAGIIGELPDARLELRGVTLHQARVLEYLRAPHA